MTKKLLILKFTFMNLKLGLWIAAITFAGIIIYDLLLSKIFAKMIPSLGFGFERKTMV